MSTLYCQSAHWSPPARALARTPFFVAVLLLLCTAAAPALAQANAPLSSPPEALFDDAGHAAFLAGLDAPTRVRAVELKSRVVVPGRDAVLEHSPLRQHLYVRFTRILTNADRGYLVSLGAEVREYVENLTYVVDCRPGVLPVLASDPLVDGIAAIQPEDKVPANVGRRRSPYATQADTAPLPLMPYRVRAHLGVPLADVRDALAPLGVAWREVEHGDALALEADLTADQALAVAAVDGVAAVDPLTNEMTIDNADAQAYARVDVAQAPPYGLDGAGVTVLVRDAGRPGHTDYDSRLTVLESTNLHYHHIHVTGTIAGDGSGNSLAEGMAPAASIVSNDFYGSLTLDLRDPFIYDDARLSNHSYGLIEGWAFGGSTYYTQSAFGDYSVYSNEWDSVIYDNDLLVVKSAGNDRGDVDGSGAPHSHNGSGNFTDSHPADCSFAGAYKCISGGAVAKNVIVVGAVDQDNSMSSFSSFGPPDDGRIKPDVVADGVALLSTYTSNGYATLSGTSMSSPVTTGSLALFTQYYKTTFGGGTAEPPAALAKACLIHGARDLQPADGSPFYQVGPDYASGYGAVDIVNSIRALDNHTMDAVTNGETDVYPVTVLGGGQPLKVTLAWIDPPGSTVAANAIVNDLDLTVTAPDATVHHPWKLDPLNPADPATTGVNGVDTVEMVLVAAPTAGVYTIRVAGTTVPTGPQAYALVVSGDLATSPASGVTLTPDVPSPQPADTAVTWTAAGEGGSGFYEYQFSLQGPATGNVMTVQQAYSPTATWTWHTTYATGTNTIKVQVRNQGSAAVEEAVATQTFTVDPVPVGLRPDAASPGEAGTPVTWIAFGGPGSGPFEYRFWLKGPGTGNTWQMQQDYGVGTTWTWSPAAADVGTNTVAVWVRTAGSSVAYQDIRTAAYDVNPGPPPPPPGRPASITVPTSDADGSYTVSWTAASGIVDTYYLIESAVPDFNPYRVVYQGAALSHDISGKTDGTYYYSVWACNAGGCGTALAGANGCTVTLPAQANLTLTPGALPPGLVGTPVTWTASGGPGLGPFEYRFWLRGPATGNLWQMQQDYGVGATWTWTPGAADVGTSTVLAAVRTVGSTAGSEDSYGVVYTINASPPPSPPGSVTVPLTDADGRFTVSWTASSGDVIAYDLEMATAPDFSDAREVFSGAASYSSANVTVDRNGTYYFRARACNSSGCSGYTAGANGCVVTDAGPKPLTLTPDVPSPGSVGTPVTWTAGGGPGSGPFEYRFWLRGPATGNAWRMQQDYGVGTTWTWTPSSADVGADAVAVWVRTAGSTVSYAAYTSVAYNVQAAPPPPAPGAPASIAVPVSDGDGAYTVSWTAATGTVDAYHLYEATQADFSNAALVYQGAALNAALSGRGNGTYYYRVQACNTGGCSGFATGGNGCTVTLPTPAALAATPDAPSPGTAGTPVVWTASGGPGSGPFEYRFWLKGPATGNTWQLQQDYGVGTTWTWTPSSADVGANAIGVWVRTAGSTAAYEAYTSVSYTVNP